MGGPTGPGGWSPPLSLSMELLAIQWICPEGGIFRVWMSCLLTLFHPCLEGIVGVISSIPLSLPRPPPLWRAGLPPMLCPQT